MRSEELDYPLPPECVATAPAVPRDAARLLVFHAERGAIEHRTVRELPDLLRSTDALVFNTTSVMPARIVARRGSGGRVEGLALEALEALEGDGDGNGAIGAWRVLLRGSARLRPGERLMLESEGGHATGDLLQLEARDGEAWRARFLAAESSAGAGGRDDAARVLQRSGHVPLPPYILGARRERGEPDERREDRAWYQTVYADRAAARSVAAPTAGLHFTPGLLDELRQRGVGRIDVTLEVGPGTFKPVSAATLEEHVMHRERFQVSAAALAALRAQQASGGRVIAVGTTSVRTLESLATPLPHSDPDSSQGPVVGETSLLIAPGHTFRVVDGLLTNFHLPRSTLLALVAAMVGLERLKAIYAEAIAQGYRFYSYGDAMLVLGLERERRRPRDQRAGR